MGRYILIVDDHRDTVDSLAMLLKFNGFSPLMACDGEEALAIATREPPGVVLLDMYMPGLDGGEVCRRLRRQPWGKDMLIVAITGPGKRYDALAAGCDEHLVKPVRIARLLELIASATCFGGGRSPGLAQLKTWPLAALSQHSGEPLLVNLSGHVPDLGALPRTPQNREASCHGASPHAGQRLAELQALPQVGAAYPAYLLAQLIGFPDEPFAWLTAANSLRERARCRSVVDAAARVLGTTSGSSRSLRLPRA